MKVPLKFNRKTLYFSYQRTDLIVRNRSRIFHGCMVWIEKSVTRVTDRRHEAWLIRVNGYTFIELQSTGFI